MIEELKIDEDVIEWLKIVEKHEYGFEFFDTSQAYAKKLLKYFEKQNA